MVADPLQSFGDKLIAESTRTCGGCDLCCEAMGITSIGKPPQQRCPHQRFPGLGAGCMVYGDHPQECRDFYCMWRIADMIPLHWKPSEVGFVVAVNDANIDPLLITIHVDPKRPNAWNTPAFRSGFRTLSIKTLAIVVVGGGGEGHTIFSPAGRVYTREDAPQLFVGTNVGVPEADMIMARKANPEKWAHQKALLAAKGAPPARRLTITRSRARGN